MNPSPVPWLSTLTVLPILVFLAETCVVTLCTVRTICITRGRKGTAAALGFFEVSIWLYAIGQIMQHLDNWSCYVAFASGFSLGNFLGVVIEQKLATGSLAVHVRSWKRLPYMSDVLRAGRAWRAPALAAVDGSVKPRREPRIETSAILDPITS